MAATHHHRTDLISAATMDSPHLADAARAEYRAILTLAVAEGRARPLVLPICLLGPFIVPTLWLTVPHSRRGPWMRVATWLVVAFVVVFDVDLVWRTSSTNMACAYGTGLMACWGIISTLNVLVWNEPQVDAARIIRRRKVRGADGKPASLANGHASQHDNNDRTGANGPQDGLRQRKEDMTLAVPPDGSPRETKATESEYEHVWQPFPEDAPFLERLNWALDMTTNFRFAGWNWSISAIPRPKIPSTRRIPDGTPVDMATIPAVTEVGYRRCLTPSGFLRDRVRTIAITYLALDFLAVFMTKDPYFILGPDHHLLELMSRPSHLEPLPPWALRTYRHIFSLAGVLCAVAGIFGVNDLAQYYLASCIFPARRELYQHASTFGSFTAVLDRGLAGWWGSWWHQSFRVQFAAPARWLLRHGYIERGTGVATVVALALSFAQSGALHAAGAMSSVPRVKLWRSPAFFLLQAVGILLQYGISSLASRYLLPLLAGRKLPAALLRAANLTFTLTWLYATAGVFTDDLASTGIWLLEPVPFSFFRAFGFGYPGDRWWRWDEHYFPRWHSGEHWWQSGIAV